MTPSRVPSSTQTRTPTETPTNTPTQVPVEGNYYVDSVNGSDSNSGTTTASPWKTLANVNARTFQPGDTINLKRGSLWSDGLVVSSSGTFGQPITYRAYGYGPAPIIENPGQWHQSIRIAGSWVLVQDILVRNADESGVRIESSGSHDTIQNVEATNVGIGVLIDGPYNLVTHNYAHDLKMVVNTPGGDDDYGAVGFWIQAPNNEVSYNRCANCRAPSYDYGSDGGVIEIFGNGDNSYIHHNYGTGSDGFVEAGGGSAQNVYLAYNVSDNNDGGFACIHMGDKFSSTINNFHIENNTIVKTNGEGHRQLDCLGYAPSPSQIVMRNNIFFSAIAIAKYGTFTHTNDIYGMIGDVSIGYPLGDGEQTAAPRFVDPSSADYHLQATSPAISSGLKLGYTLDFDNRPILQSRLPDLGAFEYPQP